MITSHDRGHQCYFNTDMQKWLYTDTNEPVYDTRPCRRCGQMPTPEGYDACLGYIEGAESACCGHGVTEPYIFIGGDSE